MVDNTPKYVIQITKVIINRVVLISDKGKREVL